MASPASMSRSGWWRNCGRRDKRETAIGPICPISPTPRMKSQATSFLDSKVLSRLLALPLNARQAMVGGVSGRHRSPIRGSSIEFSQYRKYVAGDDTRRLDWRTWGRTDRFYIKEFEADTNLRLALIVDASGSMGYGPAGATRLDYSRKLGGSLGWLAAHQGDAVGLWGVGKDHRQKLPAKRGATHFKLILDQLSSLE